VLYRYVSQQRQTDVADALQSRTAEPLPSLVQRVNLSLDSVLASVEDLFNAFSSSISGQTRTSMADSTRVAEGTRSVIDDLFVQNEKNEPFEFTETDEEILGL
jgi:hypothetical protein